MATLIRLISRTCVVGALSVAACAGPGAPTTGPAAETVAGEATPTGKMITPTAAAGAIFQDLNPGHAAAPDLRAGQAAAIAVSPDGRLLAILTSGYNLHYAKDGKLEPELSTEYVFVFDITGPRPQQLQVILVPNTFQGLAWAPAADRLFVSGGKDDAVIELTRKGSALAVTRRFRLEHKAGIGVDATPMAGGLAVSPDGSRILVTNFQNESVSLIDLKSGQVVAEQDLRPGIIDPTLHGVPGGSYPRSVVWASAERAYVASERDREVISLHVPGQRMRVVRRMPVSGQPVALIANRPGSRLYVALDNTDRVAIFDTAGDALVEELNVVAPDGVYLNTRMLGGANSNALVLTPDERTLLVSNGGQNAVAVVRLGEAAMGEAARARRAKDRDGGEEEEGDSRSEVVALVPTGFYPTGVATSRDGASWYVINAKSPTGSNVRWCQEVDPARNRCIAMNPPDARFSENGQDLLRVNDQTVWQLQKAGFLTMPAPGPLELARLTKQVARNNSLDRPDKTAADEKLFAFLREHIKHVIFVIKENRSYDQILGDLEVGNGDPRLALFPEAITPNHHAIARTFVTLDNFLVSGEGSATGWDWSTAGRTNDFRERQEPLLMAHRGLDWGIWGVSRGLNMGFATGAERKKHDPRASLDPDILPGNRDVAELDGPGGQTGKGYIWDAALRRGLRVRNYGFFAHFGRPIPTVRNAFERNVQVFYPANPSLMPYSDLYFHTFNPAFPDYWRILEWKREFEGFSKSKVAPNLMLVMLGGDHIGDFAKAVDGVDTPETQMADNDYALGLLTEAVANSPFADSTLIVSVEDDTWDGPDHVDAFRSPIFFAGPYVRQRVLVSTRYTTASVLKTIEEILGIDPVGLNDALAAPMSDVFDTSMTSWSYKAIVPEVLRTTRLPLPVRTNAAAQACGATPRHPAAYWAKAMEGRDFSSMDAGEFGSGNEALWRGLKGEVPYPEVRAGENLRENRAELLAAFRAVRDAACTGATR